jgi:hypothetical protein
METAKFAALYAAERKARMSTIVSSCAQPKWRYRYAIAALLFFAYTIQYLDPVKTTTLMPLIR